MPVIPANLVSPFSTPLSFRGGALAIYEIKMWWGPIKVSPVDSMDPFLLTPDSFKEEGAPTPGMTAAFPFVGKSGTLSFPGEGVSDQPPGPLGMLHIGAPIISDDDVSGDWEVDSWITISDYMNHPVWSTSAVTDAGLAPYDTVKKTWTFLPAGFTLGLKDSLYAGDRWMAHPASTFDDDGNPVVIRNIRDFLIFNDPPYTTIGTIAHNAAWEFPMAGYDNFVDFDGFTDSIVWFDRFDPKQNSTAILGSGGDATDFPIGTRALIPPGTYYTQFQDNDQDANPTPYPNPIPFDFNSPPGDPEYAGDTPNGWSALYEPVPPADSWYFFPYGTKSFGKDVQVKKPDTPVTFPLT